MTAGLAMQVLEAAAAEKPKRSKSGEVCDLLSCASKIC